VNLPGFPFFFPPFRSTQKFYSSASSAISNIHSW
jgi:hypothetical protein